MSKYQVRLMGNGATAVYHVTYKNGVFSVLKYMRGKLNQQQYQKLMYVIPTLEKVIPLLMIEYEGRIEYKLISSGEKSLFRLMLDYYSTWYLQTQGIPPKIDGVSGSHLKKIITYLTQLSTSDNEVITVWNQIFDNWNELDEFYQSQTELRQINSNLNIILTTIKNGKSNNQAQRTASNRANDYREAL
jgi:hypothetical protein